MKNAKVFINGSPNPKFLYQLEVAKGVTLTEGKTPSRSNIQRGTQHKNRHDSQGAKDR